MISATEMEDAICATWSPIEPLRPDELEVFGDEAANRFARIRPIDTALDEEAFSSVNMYLDFKPNVTAAYLGIYLIEMLEGYRIQRKINFPIDAGRRAEVINTLTDPNFWKDVLSPYLPKQCHLVVGRMAEFIVEQQKLFCVTEDQRRALERLSRSVKR